MPRYHITGVRHDTLEAANAADARARVLSTLRAGILAGPDRLAAFLRLAVVEAGTEDAEFLEQHVLPDDGDDEGDDPSPRRQPTS